MPTTLVSLVLFIFLVAPGFVYVNRRQRDMPYKDRSIFRETVDVGIAGLAFNLAIFVPLLSMAWFKPSIIFNVGALIADPQSYLASHWFRVGLWTLGALAVAIALAHLVGSRQKELHPSDSSSWEELFKSIPKGYEKDYGRKYESYVSCELEDGSWVAGIVFDYNPTGKEDGDRDLILKKPIEYRPRGKSEAVPYEGPSAVCVSARDIRTMFVTWGPKGFANRTPLAATADPAVQVSAENLGSMSVTRDPEAATDPLAQSQGAEARGEEPPQAEVGH